MILPASELLLQVPGNHYHDSSGGTTTTATITTTITTIILQAISVLDQYDASHWNLRLVTIGTIVLLFLIRIIFRKAHGIDWYAFVHAIISAGGSLACTYLDVVASESLTGIPEPLRSCQCYGPLTSLHRVLPAITAGYSIFDLLDGFTIGWDFVLHGSATLLVMAFFVEHNLSQFLCTMLLMEVSTVFLTIVRADFFSETVAIVVQALFALTFFLFRVVIVPYLWAILMITMNEERSKSTYQACIPAYVFPFCLIFGFFFHALNFYWFIKICKKIRRKVLGIEKIKSRNDLKEQEDHHDDGVHENSNKNIDRNGHNTNKKKN